MAVFEFEAMSDAVFTMLLRVRRSLTPEHMAPQVETPFRQSMLDQFSEAFSKEGPASAGRWAPLSDWRVRDRGGVGHPILDDTGGLVAETKGYRGKMRVLTGSNEGFSYWFPDFPEMSGKYWGLTAGQMENPLGATPLAAVPRPLLAGAARQAADTTAAFVVYFREQGYEVEVE